MDKKFKVLMINGSPRKNGNIAVAFSEMEKVFEENGVEYENILLGTSPIRGCIACESCRKTGKCVFDDKVNELSAKFEEADGLVIGSPVYYGSANGTLLAALMGNAFLGLPGMLIFIPLTSVVYTLLRENTDLRLRRKNINIP